ncbi:MAG: Dam family site-specific DNA-(adenine-N6)-methyltransferase [Terriglobia bacterium]
MIESHQMPSDCHLRNWRERMPILRWAGSKRRLVPVLRTYWNKNHRRYLEPFAGSACLFFSLNPKRAILGDVNHELIATYLEVKYRVDGVIRELAALRPSREQYDTLRALSPSCLDASARAARFIYLNRFCFNGLYRTNLEGRFNVPYSGERCGALPSSDHLKQCSRTIRHARLINADFECVLSKAERGDFVYMDPPFAVRARRVFREYDPSAFMHGDIARLRSWMDKLAAARVTFVVSYAESEEADILRKGFDHQTVSVRRNIAGFAAKRFLSNEILISNV